MSYPTPPHQPMPPGQCHPALAHIANTIRSAAATTVAAPVPAALADARYLDPGSTSDAKYTLFVKKRAAASIDRRVGVYTWFVWEDAYGRQIGDDPDRTRWVRNDTAVLYGYDAAPTTPA